MLTHKLPNRRKDMKDTLRALLAAGAASAMVIVVPATAGPDSGVRDFKSVKHAEAPVAADESPSASPKLATETPFVARYTYRYSFPVTPEVFSAGPRVSCLPATVTAGDERVTAAMRSGTITVRYDGRQVHIEDTAHESRGIMVDGSTKDFSHRFFGKRQMWLTERGAVTRVDEGPYFGPSGRLATIEDASSLFADPVYAAVLPASLARQYGFSSAAEPQLARLLGEAQAAAHDPSRADPPCDQTTRREREDLVPEGETASLTAYEIDAPLSYFYQKGAQPDDIHRSITIEEADTGLPIEGEVQAIFAETRSQLLLARVKMEWTRFGSEPVLSGLAQATGTASAMAFRDGLDPARAELLPPPFVDVRLADVAFAENGREIIPIPAVPETETVQDRRGGGLVLHRGGTQPGR
jgi:hypothetical protein